MKKVLCVLMLALAVAGCSANKCATESVKDSVVEQVKEAETIVKEIENSLPEECKTESVIREINAQKTKLQSILVGAENISAVCKAEKMTLNAKIEKWQAVSFALAVIILLLLVLFLKNGRIL